MLTSSQNPRCSGQLIASSETEERLDQILGNDHRHCP